MKADKTERQPLTEDEVKDLVRTLRAYFGDFILLFPSVEHGGRMTIMTNLKQVESVAKNLIGAVEDLTGGNIKEMRRIRCGHEN